MADPTRKSIKEWAIEDRPREKMMRLGASSLTESELLAIIIGSGNDTKSAVGLAQEILDHYGNKLARLGKCTIHELIIGFKGIGEAKAISIIAAAELGRRRKEEHEEVQIIRQASDVVHLLAPKLQDLSHEEFWTLYLSNSNKVLHQLMHTRGGLTQTVVDVRPIIRHAISLPGCTGIIACHNHPSGNTKPSPADDHITQKLKQASAYFDLRLLDHVIIADHDFFSYQDAGIL